MKNRRKYRVLIADDEETNLSIMKEILKPEYELLIAKNGRQVLNRIQPDNLPDLILLDILMPDLDGYATCRELKKNELTKNIPVIFVTAISEVMDAAKGFETGAIDYITKPFNPPTILARIQTHISYGEAREKLKKQNAELRKSFEFKENVDKILRHDLKNPLSALISSPQMLTDMGPLNQEQRKVIDHMQDVAYQMLDMINRSLDLFRMELGTYAPEKKEVDLITVINKVVGHNGAAVSAKQNAIRVVLPDGDDLSGSEFIVYGEDMLFYSLFANLVQNALEASPESQDVVITLSKKDKRALVSIKNQGAVPEMIRDKFFDKYTTCGKRNGTGLGTYSAKLICETMDGKISLDSSRVDATMINIELPLPPSVG